jgi:hypothetical protein
VLMGNLRRSGEEREKKIPTVYPARENCPHTWDFVSGWIKRNLVFVREACPLCKAEIVRQRERNDRHNPKQPA